MVLHRLLRDSRKRGEGMDGVVEALYAHIPWVTRVVVGLPRQVLLLSGQRDHAVAANLPCRMSGAEQTLSHS